MEMKKCSSCELYCIGNLEDLINDILKISGDKQHITNIDCKAYTCHMCRQNRTLLEHIKEQNVTIDGLHSRINSLTVIKNMECEIDDISKQFSEISVNSQSDISFIAPPVAATETHSIVDTTATSVDTTIWDSTYSGANSLMLHESIHKVIKETETATKQQQTPTVHTAHQEVQTSPFTCEKVQVVNKEVQTLLDQESSQPEIIDEFSSTPFSKIDTLLIGDKAVEHVKLDSKHKTLKIARSDTSVQK